MCLWRTHKIYTNYKSSSNILPVRYCYILLFHFTKQKSVRKCLVCLCVCVCLYVCMCVRAHTNMKTKWLKQTWYFVCTNKYVSQLNAKLRAYTWSSIFKFRKMLQHQAMYGVETKAKPNTNYCYYYTPGIVTVI